MVHEFSNQYNKWLIKTLRLMLALLSKENTGGQYDGILSHLNAAGAQMFHDLLWAIPNERIKSIYQAKARHPNPVEGLLALVETFGRPWPRASASP